MMFFRKFLFPFSLIYGGITALRNFLFDNGFFKSFSFDMPIIAVGNLSVGGTGKTPQIEYLIQLLSENFKVATLSRGYKRQSKGFILANKTTTALAIGDEPFQYFQKFKNILVAVDANRKNGIEQLFLLDQKPEVILLDDAFQHRKVKAGFYILLTTFDDLYADDFILPAGNLRESRSGAKRANCIIVTKCPKQLSSKQQQNIKNKLKIAENQLLFFSYIDYDECVYSSNESLKVSEILNENKLIVAGIAKPKSFIDFLKHKNDEVMIFADHHHFSENDVAAILAKANGNKIITTEKDFVRLQGRISDKQLFYLPIKTTFIQDKEIFNKTIINYVGNRSRNR